MSICEEVDDKSKALGFQATIRKARPGGRIGAERKKTTPEMRRTKAVGGGKTEPIAPYKPRKDIGKQKGSQIQEPEQERGSARERQLAAAKEERRKAAQARIAAKKKGGEAPAAEKPKAKEVVKAATKLLSKKKATAEPAPGYKPQKASGLSRQERLHVTRKGEQKLRDLVIAGERERGKTVKSEKDLQHRYTSR